MPGFFSISVCLVLFHMPRPPNNMFVQSTAPVFLGSAFSRYNSRVSCSFTSFSKFQGTFCSVSFPRGAGLGYLVACHHSAFGIYPSDGRNTAAPFLSLPSPLTPNPRTFQEHSAHRDRGPRSSRALWGPAIWYGGAPGTAGTGGSRWRGESAR